MNSRIDPAAASELLAAADYREFLKIYLRRGRGKRLTMDALARKAQFSSRSFIANVMSGERRITPATLPRFKQALNLPGRWAQYFDCLVMLGEPDCRPPKLDEQGCRARLEMLRNKVQKTPTLNDRAQAQQILSSQHVFDVYAALGSPEKGADLNQLAKRTGLGLDILRSVLHRLSETGFVSRQEDRFFARTGDLDFEQIGSEIGFRQAFQEALDTLKAKSRQMAVHPDCLFFHTAFVVPEGRLPALKQKIREAVLEAIEQEQLDDGESVVRVTMGCY